MNDATASLIPKSAYDQLPNYLLYAPLIASSEAERGIPAGLLARLLYVESHYRSDIISGRLKSRTGAEGIAQFEPETARELRVDPLNPEQAIPGAARYLSVLYAELGGDWADTVAAYNWGIGNVRRWALSGHGMPPAETVKYVASITGVSFG